ncbi:MAG: hypothetical protein ACRC3Y_16205 [Romboutsia sp.]|uniref:hypothetical protein n=1 Tax=Romboutsia sp. TaxID=1965302 RepID=UPI003F2BDF19
MKLKAKILSEEQAKQISTWRYEGNATVNIKYMICQTGILWLKNNIHYVMI